MNLSKEEGDDTFQFPSNGKADPKDIRSELGGLDEKRFNSLQTGKRIQSDFSY